MRRIIALTCVCWLAVCAGRENNIAPLAFGMTADEVATVLGAPLAYVKGRPGSELFVAQYRAEMPGIHPVDERLTLQFRRGRLTGWKHDWRMRPLRSW